MTKHQKLELTWIGKDEQARLEPRILIEDAERSYGLINRKISPNPSLSKRGTQGIPHLDKGYSQFPPLEKGGEGGFYGNMLIHGDNLLALKAIEQDFAGKIKCIYIDPPYNTGNAFEHYDDGLEHSIWLSLIKPRIEMLHRLLSNDGTLWISIDDDESHYLKVICDEVFGRKNFVNNVIWEKKYSPQNDAKWLSDSHDHILVYAKNKEIWRPNLLPRTAEMDSRYKNPDNDPRGPWKSSGLDVKTYSAVYDYPITTPSGRIVYPPGSSCWRLSKERFEEKDYIFTTTNFVTVEFLDKIHEEMQPDESLLICCKSFSKACESRHLNITVKKIPKMLLGRCEFGKEDYSLNIVNMPVDENEPQPESVKVQNKSSRKVKDKTQGELFIEEEVN